jgi:hypothetical protein
VLCDVACCDFSGDAQAWRLTIARLAVSTEQGVAIHSRVGEGWYILLGDDVLGKNEAVGFG